MLNFIKLISNKLSVDLQHAQISEIGPTWVELYLGAMYAVHALIYDNFDTCKVDIKLLLLILRL